MIPRGFLMSGDPVLFSVIFADMARAGVVNIRISRGISRQNAEVFVKRFIPSTVDKPSMSFSSGKDDGYATVVVHPDDSTWGYSNVQQFYTDLCKYGHEVRAQLTNLSFYKT